MMWQLDCTFTPGKTYREIGWFLSAEEFKPKFQFQKGLINKFIYFAKHKIKRDWTSGKELDATFCPTMWPDATKILAKNQKC